MLEFFIGLCILLFLLTDFKFFWLYTELKENYRDVNKIEIM